MSLSEHEQRALREIERSLLAEDPSFGRSVSMNAPSSVSLPSLRGVAIIAVGLSVMVGGVALSQNSLWFVLMGIAGFLIMLAGGVWMLHHGKAPSRASKKPGRSVQVKQSSGFGDKLDENFRRRFER